MSYEKISRHTWCVTLEKPSTITVYLLSSRGVSGTRDHRVHSCGILQN